MSSVGSAAAVLLLPLVSFGWKRDRIREVEAELVPTGEEEHLPSIASGRTAREPWPVAADPPGEEEPPPPAVPTVASVAPNEVEAATAAAPIREENEPQTVTDPAAPVVSSEEWSCEIALWRDDRRAVFYARAFHDDVEIPLAESSPFQLAAREPPARTPAAIEAHRRLFDELTADGWVHVERGSEWYGDHFRRPFSVSALNSSLQKRLVYTRRL